MTIRRFDKYVSGLVFALVLLLAQVSTLSAGPLLAGIDVLQQTDFAGLEGKRVGVITNQTGVDRHGRSLVDLLFAAKKLTLVAIFSPEHGFRGDQDAGAHVDHARDAQTGLPVFSLYGKTRRPTAEMLRGIDTLVFDIQDVGARFYTYLSTMGICMEEAAAHGIEFVVLDRPNPLGGDVLEGPVLEKTGSFVGYFPVPIRHGLTAGEMARLHAEAKGLKLRLTVIPVRGWRRSMLFDQTGRSWVRPSPNLRSLDAALLYPGLCLFEATNLSVGRGTDAPFRWFGAPWLDAKALVRTLEAARLAGVRFHVEARTPATDVHARRWCHGVRVEVTDRAAVRSVAIFVHVVCALRDQGVAEFALKRQHAALLVGSDIFAAVFRARRSPAQILAGFATSAAGCAESRRPHLLY